MWRHAGSGHGGVANAVSDLDGWSGVGDAETDAGQHVLVNTSVEIGEALSKLHLFTIDGNRSKRGAPWRRRKWQIAAFGREEPSDSRSSQFQVTGHARRLRQVDIALGRVAKQPQE